jgi:hypothetical protein
MDFIIKDSLKVVGYAVVAYAIPLSVYWLFLA